MAVTDELSFKTDENEVENTIWVALDELRYLTSGDTGSMQVVPNGQDYFTSLFKQIDRLATDD